MGAFDPILLGPSHRTSSIPRVAIVAFIAFAAVFLLWVINGHSHELEYPVLAIAGFALAYYGVPYAARHNEWIVLPLVLIFLIISISFFSLRLRALFHYSALFLFCIPLLPRVWRSRILHTGNFRLYAIYFLWGALTIIWSLAPEFSLARLIEASLVMLAVAACVLDVDDSAAVIRVLRHFLIGCGAILVLLLLSFVLLPHSLTYVTPWDSYTAAEALAMQKAGFRIDGIDRFRGILNGPNDVGGLMLITIGAALVCWQSSTRRQKILLALTIGCSAIFAALADSRSPFIAIGLGVVAYIIWKKGIRGALICSGVLAAALAAAFAINPGLFAYFARGNVSTLTGRTDIWVFAIKCIKARPIRGYGYEVSGAIFSSKYFPLWWGPWDYGPHSSLHNGYIGHAVGVGIPAALFWLYIIMRPWFFIFRQDGDPWRLKSIFFLVAVPILINNISEQLLGDFGGSSSLLFGLSWALAERYRLLAVEQAASEEKDSLRRMPRAVAALMACR